MLSACVPQRGGRAWLDCPLFAGPAPTLLPWLSPPPPVHGHLQIFKIRPGMTVGELNLNSEWQEPGENTFMREPLTWEAFGQASRQAAGGGVGRQREAGRLLFELAAGCLARNTVCPPAAPTSPALVLPCRWVLIRWCPSTCTCA